jgi:hypothetical protein
MGDPPGTEVPAACDRRKLLFTPISEAPNLTQLKHAKGLIIAVPADATGFVLNE